MKKAGVILAIVWVLGSIYFFITAQEMEILIALYFSVIGGFVVISYFLSIWVIISYRKKKNYKVKLIILGLWLLVPILSFVISDIAHKIENAKYERYLENNVPTEQLVRNLSTLSPFVREADSFFTYKNHKLILAYEINKEEALVEFNKLRKTIKEEDTQEVIMEDFIGRNILSVHLLHSSLWNETLHPRKITVQLYLDGAVFYETTSIKGEEPQMEDFLAKHQELYNWFENENK